jgi:hypothetical protein
MKLYDFKHVPTGIKARIRSTLAERRMALDAHRRGHFFVSSSSSPSSASASERRRKETVRIDGRWVELEPPQPPANDDVSSFSSRPAP